MKIESRARETQTTGTVDKKKFQIATTPEAIRILSDGLYSDKIRAVIRELSTNAYDSHIEAGNADTPFDVKFPNHIDPSFRIRDYGTGLSHEDIMTIYSTYFSSTKSDSNDQIGALGLGSKSPFSYTDGFVVESYVDGKLRAYNINLGDDGIPTIELMIVNYEYGDDGEMDMSKPVTYKETNEPNGLAVSFAVKEQNYQDFINKAQTVYYHFDPLPNFSGAEHFEADTRDYIHEGTDWKLYKTSRWNAKVSAVMGLIDYPIDAEKLIDVSDDDKQLLRDLPFELHVAIGDLDISASREHLSYDTRTSQNIVKHAHRAMDELVTQLQENFKQCKTLWEARLAHHTAFAEDYAVGQLLRNKRIELKWKGQIIHSQVEFNLRSDEYKGVTFNYMEPDTNNDGHQVIRQRKATGFGGSTAYRTIYAKGDVEVYIDTGERGTLTNVRHYAGEHRDDKNVYFVQGATKAQVQLIRKTLGMTSLPCVSILPKPPKAVRGTTTQGNSITHGKIRMWTLDQKEPLKRNFEYWSRAFTPVDNPDYSTGGLYIPTLRLKPQSEKYGSTYDFPILLKALYDIEALNKLDVVYAVSKSDCAKLEKEGGWRNFFDVMEEHLLAKVDDAELIADLSITVNRNKAIQEADDLEWCAVNSEYALLLLNHMQAKLKKPNELIDAVVEMYHTLAVEQSSSTQEKLNRVITAIQKAGGDVELTTDTISLRGAIEKLVETYPVTKMMFMNPGMFHDYDYGAHTTIAKESEMAIIVDYVKTFEVV